MNPTQSAVLQPYIDEAKRIWHSIPPRIQTSILVFESAAGTFLGTTAGQYLLNPDSACWKWKCLRIAIGGAIVAGAEAAKNFWMRPGPGRQGGPPKEISKDGEVS